MGRDVPLEVEILMLTRRLLYPQTPLFVSSCSYILMFRLGEASNDSLKSQPESKSPLMF
jgi:hypothetical protein